MFFSKGPMKNVKSGFHCLRWTLCKMKNLSNAERGSSPDESIENNNNEWITSQNLPNTKMERLLKVQIRLLKSVLSRSLLNNYSNFCIRWKFLIEKLTGAIFFCKMKTFIGTPCFFSWTVNKSDLLQCVMKCSFGYS